MASPFHPQFAADKQASVARFADISQMTEDDMFWLLGIGRFGQSEYECDFLPQLLRSVYGRMYLGEVKAVDNIRVGRVSDDRSGGLEGN